MSNGGRVIESSRACKSCLRRSWLLSALSAMLDYQCSDRGRLLELLKLSDESLVLAVGGRQREELRTAWSQFQEGDVPQVQDVEAMCLHDPSYPSALRDIEGPRILHVAGGVRRLEMLSAAPTVAIVGSSRATDYGMEMARPSRGAWQRAG
jgi:predicted Rossmann fold nucleotide-binding protein DprA/Smf involved in DNA uptake